MSATPMTGTLLLADLTGYTAYLSGSEIEHAPMIAGDLLETSSAASSHRSACRSSRAMPRSCTSRTGAPTRRSSSTRSRPPIRVPASPPQHRCRDRLRLQLLPPRPSAGPQAVRPPRPVRRRVDRGTGRVAGADVILAHRLLKGEAAATRGTGFAEFTSAAAATLGVVDDEPADRVTEVFEHVGSVEAVVVDLDGRWQAETGRQRVGIDAEDALLDVEAVLHAPPADCWASIRPPQAARSLGGPDLVHRDIACGPARRRHRNRMRNRSPGDARGDR